MEGFEMNPSLPDFIVNRLKMISGKTIERKGCQANLAFDVGRHHSYVSEVMNGYRFLDDEERKIWAKELDLEPEDFPIPIYKMSARRRNRQIIGWSNKENSDAA
jgi:hypothetical protein